jgi:hypothetical protein
VTVLLGLLLVLLGGLAYGVWVLWVYLRHVRRRREHYLQHGHRRGATMGAQPRNHTMPPDPILRYFEHDHLPSSTMRDVARTISELAHAMDDDLHDGPEKSAGLRKLLEAKDCFVRAALPDRSLP